MTLLYRVDNRKKNFKPILQKWISIIKSYSDSQIGDHLYWYNERASLSTFAGAVYSDRSDKKPHFALEEYRATKGRRRVEGRIDMWLRLGTVEYVIEAKQKWISITKTPSDSQQTIKSIQRTLDKAKKDAEKSAQGTKGYHPEPIGLIFIIPYFKKNGGERLDKPREFLKTLGNELAKIDCFCYALAFPDNGMITETIDGYRYPGVALLMK